MSHQNHPSPLTGCQLITQFFNLTLPPGQFKHRAHLQLSWLLLREHHFTTACTKVLKGIQAYAAHLGATDKFHHTLTIAALHLIAHRMQPQHSNFETFIRHHPELLQLTKLLSQHYSHPRLYSAEAKQQFAAPDLAPLPEPSSAHQP